MIKFLNREAPAVVVAGAALFGIGVAAYVGGVAISAVKLDAEGGTLLAFLLAMLAVVALAIAVAFTIGIGSRGSSLGGPATLFAFMCGSIFTLFETPTDMFGGQFAELSKWQAGTWAVSVVIAAGAMVVQATRKRDPQSSLAKTAGGDSRAPRV